MICPKCNGSTWILYIGDAPVPPYKEGEKLEFARRCGCFEPKRRKQEEQR